MARYAGAVTPAFALRRNIIAGDLPDLGHAILQVVLLLGVILALHRPAAAGSGVVAGLLIAASLAFGLNALPLSVGLGLIAAVRWAQARPGAAEHLQGIGVGVLVGLAAARGLATTATTLFA